MGDTDGHELDAFELDDDEPRLEDHTHEGEDIEAEVIDLDAEMDDPQDIAVSAADLGLDLPDDPDAAREKLLTELLLSRQESGEYLESLQRVAAEYENFRRRAERDQADLTTRGTQRLVEAMLPTLDAFDAALAYEPQGTGEEKLLAGMLGTYNQLMETLERHGLEKVDALGTPFDPAVHEAVAGGGDGELMVSQVLRSGYRLGDRVVRPTLVMVAPANETETVREAAGDED